eukprot:jgi/Ulvmu1/21/UM001_0022.1
MAWGPAPAGARAALSAAPLRRSMVGDDAGLDSSAASDAITVAETGQEGGGDTIMLEHGVVALEEGGAGRDEGERAPPNSAAAHDRPDGAESVDDMRTGYMLTYYDGEVVGADGEVVQYDDEIEYDDIEYNDIEYDGIKYDGAGLQ